MHNIFLSSFSLLSSLPPFFFSFYLSLKVRGQGQDLVFNIYHEFSIDVSCLFVCCFFFSDRELILIIVGTVFGAIILSLVIAVSVVSVR